MAAIILTPSSRPWVANAGLAGRNAPRSACGDQSVGPSVRGEAPEVRMRSFRRGRYVGLRRVQDDALERIARVVPRRPPQRTPRVGVARLPAQANPRRAEIDILGVVFVVQPGRSNRRNRARCWAERRINTTTLSIAALDGADFVQHFAAQDVEQHKSRRELDAVGIEPQAP